MSYKKQMLIVDENQGLREGLCLAFEDEFDCTFACNETEALKFSDSIVPDVILIDSPSAILEGAEIMRCLHEKAPQAHIIVLSAHDDNAAISAAMKNGAFSFIAKPFELADIQQAVTNATQPSSTRESPAVYKPKYEFSFRLMTKPSFAGASSLAYVGA